LREHGFSSAVTTPGGSRLWEFAEAAGVEIAPFPLKNSLNPLRWRELVRLLDNQAPDLVHVHDPEAASLLSRAGLFGAQAAAAATRYDIRKPPISAEFSGVGAVICPSRAVAGAFTAAKAEAGKVHIVHHGVNLAAADRALEDRDAFRARFRSAYCPAKEKPIFMVNIAPIENENGQAELLETLAESVSALPQTHLFIMGAGTLEEGLSRQIRIMALEKDVSILEPDRAYQQLLAAADLYVSASRNDVSGFMLQSAMAAGRAAALARAGCYPELSEDGINAALADPGEERSFKSAVLELLGNRNRREHLGRLARAAAVRMFDVSKQAGLAAEIYRNLPQLRERPEA
ncbi:MAG: glycosyltransferase family 4 protein, partial [Planctomycetes bacterium]|nr:glycosyltransferase family 4 protein [Planctomycetota bacterium]